MQIYNLYKYISVKQLKTSKAEITDLNVSGNTNLNNITSTGDTLLSTLSVSGDTNLNNITSTGDINLNNLSVSGDFVITSDSEKEGVQPLYLDADNMITRVIKPPVVPITLLTCDDFSLENPQTKIIPSFNVLSSGVATINGSNITLPEGLYKVSVYLELASPIINYNPLTSFSSPTSYTFYEDVRNDNENHRHGFQVTVNGTQYSSISMARRMFVNIRFIKTYSAYSIPLPPYPESILRYQPYTFESFHSLSTETTSNISVENPFTAEENNIFLAISEPTNILNFYHIRNLQVTITKV